MEGKKSNHYTLIMDDREMENIIYIITKYLDDFERESYELDTYSLNMLEYMLGLFDNDIKVKETEERISKILKRNDDRKY